MNLTSIYKSLSTICISAILTGCNGMFDWVYDQPNQNENITVSGKLYIDASDWEEWHYIDFDSISAKSIENPEYNPSSAWITMRVPVAPVENSENKAGIYTYWYDVYGAGITDYEFRSYQPTAVQPEPGSWTIAVHRNNVRTNNCTVAATEYHSINDLPDDKDYYKSLTYLSDEWNETDVWTIQDKMLLGLIGNQGIYINNTLSSWLSVMLPPIPPSFTLNNKVFIIKTPSGEYGAIQLENYQSSTGVKCCMTINYKYPL